MNTTARAASSESVADSVRRRSASCASSSSALYCDNQRWSGRGDVDGRATLTPTRLDAPLGLPLPPRASSEFDDDSWDEECDPEVYNLKAFLASPRNINEVQEFLKARGLVHPDDNASTTDSELLKLKCFLNLGNERPSLDSSFEVCKVSETVCESLAKARAEMRTMSNQVGPSGTLNLRTRRARETKRDRCWEGKEASARDRKPDVRDSLRASSQELEGQAKPCMLRRHATSINIT
eukprot:2524539-Rhodomonas_salina.3